jgi:pilus assembly protein CpaF
VQGPILEIRRTARGASADDLVGKGVMNKAMLDVLKEAVARRRNIAVVGTVGAGVTTVLGAIASLCNDGERIVTAEDVPDLTIDREHVISLATGSSRSGLSLVDVVRQASRLRSDRLVVDDVHGDNAFDVLTEAASRGEGTFLGLHCAGGEDPVAAVSLLARLGGRLTDATLGGLLSRAVHLLVQVARTDEGRRITSINELSSGNDGSLKSNSLFVYDGEFAATGRPSFAT